MNKKDYRLIAEVLNAAGLEEAEGMGDAGTCFWHMLNLLEGHFKTRPNFDKVSFRSIATSGIDSV
jgi:hypothetical protein